MVPLLAVVFIVSGASINLLQQQLYYAGAGDESSMILILPTFVGCLLGGLANPRARAELTQGPGGIRRQLPFRIKQMAAMSVFDVISQILRSIAQNLCGSGMFTVIYAILPAFNGVLSYFFMGRILNIRQWAAIAVVVLGLALSAESEESDLKNDDNDKRYSVGLGILLGLAGTLSSSASYLCAELVFKNPLAPKEGTTVTAINGINNLLLTAPWLLFYSIPNRSRLIYQPVAEKNALSPTIIIFLLGGLVAANAAHLNSCYALLQITESMTLTMLQGLRAVLVFALSGALFCTPTSPEQCLSFAKVLSSCLVVTGIVIYALSTASLSKRVGDGTGSFKKNKRKLKKKLSDDNMIDDAI